MTDFRLASLRASVNALLDSADRRADTDPMLALCEVNAAILVLGAYKEAIVSNVVDDERREYLLKQAKRPA